MPNKSYQFNIWKMELLLLGICLLPILSLLAINFLPRNGTSSKPQKNDPPGSHGWPVIGETLELAKAGGEGIPEKFYETRMKKHSSKVFKTSIIGESTSVFCGAAGNKFLFSNENKLVSISFPRNIKKILPHTDTIPDMATQVTKVQNILIEFLKPQFLQDYVGIVNSVAKKHLDSKWDSQKEVKVLPLIQEYAFAVACKIFLSIDDPKILQEITEPFYDFTTGLYSMPVNLPGTAYNKAIKGSKLVREKLYGFIRERKAHVLEGKKPWSHDVLWNMILMMNDDGRELTEGEIADHLLVFFVTSQDSTTTVITFLVKFLAEFHQVHQKVLEEQRCIAEDKQNLKWEDLGKMKYSWNVASEVMRLMPPAQGNFREALTDFAYSGFFFPKGSKLFWTPHTTHKNPDYFHDPEKFDPSRFEGTGPEPYSYVPFGGGFRICPGREFARVIILVFLHNLVQRYSWEKVIPNEKIVVQPVPMPEKGLPVRLYAL